jgi:hypothetical protein
MSRGRWSYLLCFSLAVACLAAPGCANAEDVLKRIPMTAEDLAKFGIDLDLGFPNKCYYGTTLSVSDALLEHFEARGFSLRTLCLALDSSALRYDSGTGKQLPLAVRARRSKDGKSLVVSESPLNDEVVLNVPDCFKNGTPLIDCPRNYNYAFGTKEDDPDAAIREAREEDAKIRSFIRSGGYGSSRERLQPRRHAI